MTAWRPVVHAVECDDDGNCPVCHVDFADCECPGPTQEDDYEYREIDGVLEAKLLTPALGQDDWAHMGTLLYRANRIPRERDDE